MFLFRNCSNMKFISSDFGPFSRRKLNKKCFAQNAVMKLTCFCVGLNFAAGVARSSYGDRPNAVSEFCLGSFISFLIFSFEFLTEPIFVNFPTSNEELGLVFGFLRTALR